MLCPLWPPPEHCMLSLPPLGESSHLPVLPSRLWILLVQGAPARTRIKVRFRAEDKVTVWVKAGVWVGDSARARVRTGSQHQSQDC